MGRFVLIYGKSGSGKSRSLKNFGPDEIFLVNVIGKELPFRTKFKYVSITDSVDTIIAGLKRMPCKTAVIDDAGYLMTSQFMAGHSQPKKGSSSFWVRLRSSSVVEKSLTYCSLLKWKKKM